MEMYLLSCLGRSQLYVRILLHLKHSFLSAPSISELWELFTAPEFIAYLIFLGAGIVLLQVSYLYVLKNNPSPHFHSPFMQRFGNHLSKSYSKLAVGLVHSHMLLSPLWLEVTQVLFVFHKTFLQSQLSLAKSGLVSSPYSALKKS